MFPSPLPEFLVQIFTPTFGDGCTGSAVLESVVLTVMIRARSEKDNPAGAKDGQGNGRDDKPVPNPRYIACLYLLDV